MSYSQRTPDTELIWRMLSDRLRQFVRSRVSSINDVDDILQNVFLRIHQKLNTLRQPERLESWVFQIARNAIADHLRKMPKDFIDPDTAAVPLYESNANELTSEVASCLDSMLDQLPEELQRAITMYERDGISQKEIALRESISLSGAKSRVQRGRKLLKDMLQQCCQIQIDRYGNVLAWELPSANERSGCSC